MEMTVSSLALTGNAYWLVTRNAAGSINNIQVINPNLVTIEVDDKTGKKRFSYNQRFYSPKDMQHLMLMRIPGYEYGVGPIQKVRGELEVALDLRDYQGHWFTKSGVATGILKTDQPLSNEWADAYKARWEAVMNGVDRTAVLGNGLSYIPTYLNPKDAMFVEAINANLQQIARMFGIPASMLSLPIEGNSMTYSNVRDENEQFAKYTLSLYVNEIENAFSELLARGQEVKFDPSSLLRLNETERFANYAVAITNGWLSPDEVRAKEGIEGSAPTPTKSEKEEVAKTTKEQDNNEQL
jgi:HK97 family phage portal protein